MSAIALIAGDAHPELARQIACSMETSLVPVSVSAFADGETRVRIDADVRDMDLYIVQPTSVPTNERLMTLAPIADAARAAAVHALFIHAVMAPSALERICAAPVRTIMTTDSVRIAPDPRVRVVPIAPLLAQTLDRFARRSTLRTEVTNVQES